MVYTTSDNNYATARFIVGSSGQANYLTIASAIAAASSGNTIFILPGTYTENLTLKVGVDLCAYDCDALTPNVTISGTCTLTTAGTVSLSGLCLQTNSAAAIAVTGNAASILNIKNCLLNFTNNTGLTYSSSSASSLISVYQSVLNLGTTGIAFFAHSGAGSLFFFNCRGNNSGGSSTASTASNGGLNIQNSSFNAPITTSSTNILTSSTSTYNTGVLNVTALTHGGDSNSALQLCNFLSGSASSISVSTNIMLRYCTFDCTNTNVIAGAGTVTYTALSFSNTGVGISATPAGGNNKMGSLNLITPLEVASGGTGRATLTNHGVLIGASTTAITQLGTGSSGQVLQSGGASADPAYSTAAFPATATGTGTILRADGTNWAATTSTYPNTNAVNTLLYASSANVMSALATANSGVLATNGSGVPSITATPTVTSITFGSGTALGTYVQGSFTPTLFGASTAGVTTYTLQVGEYTQIGNIVFFALDVAASAATGTGNVVIGGFPVNVVNSQNNIQATCKVGSLTWPALTTETTLQLSPNGTQSLIATSGSTVASGSFLQMANATQTVRASGFYFTS